MAHQTAILLYEAIRMPIESLGLLQFHFGTCLIYVTLGAAIAPARLANAAAPPRQIVEARQIPMLSAPEGGRKRGRALRA